MQAAGELIVVLAPVLGRPERALPLAESLRSTCSARLVFLVNEDDTAELIATSAVRDRVEGVDVFQVGWSSGPGDYARKINHGVRHTTEPWIFQGADDLRFHDGWVEAVLAAAERRGGCRVIGTNDLCNPRVIRGRHSTHSLVHRSYIEEVGTVDEKGKMLHEGYGHNFCDDELVRAAMVRGEYVSAKDAHVEHLHPLCGKAEMDRTYETGMEREQFRADSLLARQRRSVWRRR